MSNELPARVQRTDLGEKFVYWLALALVIVGLLNAMPGIPGVDAAFEGFLGFKNFTIRKYPYEYFYPLRIFLSDRFCGHDDHRCFEALALARFRE